MDVSHIALLVHGSAYRVRTISPTDVEVVPWQGSAIILLRLWDPARLECVSLTYKNPINVLRNSEQLVCYQAPDSAVHSRSSSPDLEPSNLDVFLIALLKTSYDLIFDGNLSLSQVYRSVRISELTTIAGAYDPSTIGLLQPQLGAFPFAYC